MLVKIRDGKPVDVKLRIYEPPRFFEAFLRGRHFAEAPDITARICGICPVAYQTSSVNAMEDVCGVEVGPQIRALRRLLYCGEWIESHALHVFMLHAPDFLGYASAIDLAKEHRELVERALHMKKTGNELMRVIGGREVHPINVRVGGFYRSPTKRELSTLVDDLERAREFALETVRFTARLDYPELEQDYELVALSAPGAYAVEDGRLVSNRGLDIPVSEYERHFVEEHVDWSNALHSRTVEGGNYLVGPLARWALSGDRLTPLALEAAQEAGLERGERNPFRTILVRSVELVFAADEALRLIAGYEPPDPAFEEVAPRAGVGYGCSEAPRGLCWHRYEIDAEGTILDAKIVPPTSQNQATIESDLRGVVERYADLPDEELSLRCEQAIRNYDPCISCATHFLKLEVDRG
jgi:coenzyme F420-reducing hydrogenase alpha subunit